jgi:UDP-3-O-[3-hydroxymyristoyl] N-acetylglucosamine deacetylase
VPFFDGSSIEFVKFLQKTRNQNSLRTLRLSGEILIKDEESFIYYMPIKKDLLTVEMEFCHPFINLQKIVIEVNKENYVKEIAPARTFVFTDETDGRLKNLPPYGIGITKYKIYSASPLRFPDEFVRHKILDLLGDLYVLQKKLSGKIVCKNTSHNLNQKFIRRILEE